jgi:hypothetical protein
MPTEKELGGKEVEANREAASDNSDNEVLPPYQEHAPIPTSQPEDSSSVLGPTVSSPFNFPSTDLPPYSPTALNQRPIAIPQRWPDPAAPFVSAYSASLLNYGVPAQSLRSFLDTMSAFLTARVSKRAISHAGDIAAELGRVPQQLGKDVMAQAKEAGRNIATSAKQFSPVGVLGGIIGGTVGLTLGTTFRVIGSVFQLPGTAIAAAANPQTPGGRAELYAAAANRDWFHPKGLHAQLLNTVELTGLIGVSVEQFLDAANTQPGSAVEKLRALRKWIDDLEVQDSEDHGRLSPSEARPSPAITSTLAEPKQAIDTNSSVSEAAESSRSALGKRPVSAQGVALPAGALRLGTQTLWLVLFPVEAEMKEAEQSKSGKRRSKKT